MSTDQTTEHSSLFDSDDEGEDIFSAVVSPDKKVKSKKEEDPLLQIMDTENENISPNLQSPTELSHELDSQSTPESSEDLEKALTSEKARSATYYALNTELYEKLESVENELEQTKSDYATIQEKLSSKLNEESQWDSQKEALKSQLRISQDDIQKLKRKNEELGLKSKMEDSTDSNVSTSLLAIERERDVALSEKEETAEKLQKTEKELAALRKDKASQDGYISKMQVELTQKRETIAQLENKSSNKESSEEMDAKINKLEKEIALKDNRLSELEDLAVIARRSQRQDQDMKLQQEKIVTLERKIDFLQKQDHRLKAESIREMNNKSPTQAVEQSPSITVPVNPVDTDTVSQTVTDTVSQTVPNPEPLASKVSAETIEVPRISNHASKSVPITTLPPRESSNKTAIIIDKQTGKTLRTATLEERMKKFTGSAENILTGDETSATRHTFRRVSSSGSARSTPSPDLTDPRSTSQPVSPEPDKDNLLSGQSLPPGPFQAQKNLPVTFRKTYSPQPARAKVDVNPDFCIACGRRAYPIEKITVDKMPYHKFCFKCTICKSILRPGRHASYEGTIYCLNHFKQEFLGGGGKYPGQVRY